MKRRLLSLAMLVALSLTVVACTANQVFTALESALQAISVLQAFLPLAGVSPAVAADVGEYASAAATGVGQCSALLAAGGETVTLVSKCGQSLTAAIKPTLPPGTPMKVIGLVSAVYDEIQVVYDAIEANAPAPPGPVTQAKVKAHAVTAPSAVWYPSKHDASKLLGLATQAQKLANAGK